MPLAFDLEKVLGKLLINASTIKSESLSGPSSHHVGPSVSSLSSGDYYRHEEVCDAVQESLSSSSLRRKLFLDGQASYSGSDSSSPPSPERSHGRQERPSLNQGEGVISSIFSSPLSCGVSVPTPSTVSGDANDDYFTILLVFKAQYLCGYIFNFDIVEYAFVIFFS